MMLPTDIARPDWSRSIPNLIAWLSGFTGTYSPIDTKLYELPSLDRKVNVIVIVIDALGKSDIEEGGNSICPTLIQYLRKEPLYSTCPSGTASAMTAYFTGLPPQQTGISGWNQWWERDEAVVTPLLFRRRSGSDLRADGYTASDLFVANSIFATITLLTKRACFVLNPSQIANSSVSLRWAAGAERCEYADLQHMFGAIATLAQGSEPKFIFAYADRYDTYAHNYGNRSERTRTLLREIDRGVAELSDKLERIRSVIILVSDHGQIESSEKEAIIITDKYCPELCDSLSFHLTGEPRWAYAHVRAGREAAFKKAAENYLGDRVSVIESAKAIEDQYFGLGASMPFLRRRIGDFILVPRGNFVLLDRAHNEAFKPYYTGYHGGWSRAEMEIPVVVLDT